MFDIERYERKARKEYEDRKSNIVAFIRDPQERINRGLLPSIIGTLVTGYRTEDGDTATCRGEYIPIDEFGTQYFFPSDQRLDALVLDSRGAICHGKKICFWELVDEKDAKGWEFEWFDVTYDYNAEGYTYDD